MPTREENAERLREESTEEIISPQVPLPQAVFCYLQADAYPRKARECPTCHVNGADGQFEMYDPGTDTWTRWCDNCGASRREGVQEIGPKEFLDLYMIYFTGRPAGAAV